MSRITIARSRRAAASFLAIVAGLFALLIFLPTADARHPSAPNAQASQPGQPVSGQPATLRVVDLRSLPPASPSHKSSGTSLPFRPQQANPNSQITAPIVDPRSFISTRVITPTILVSFDGIDSEE